MFKLLLALAMSATSALAFAGLDRGGNVLYDGDEGPAPEWAILALLAGAAWLAWDQSEKRTKERIRSREEIEALRFELSRTKSIAADLDRKLLEADKLQAAVQRYLEGELTDEEFFRLADHITNPGRRPPGDVTV